MADANDIGIDLGTSCCRVGVWYNNRVEIIVDKHGNNKTPAFVAFTDTGVLVGDAAMEHACLDPTNTVYDVLCLMGKRYDQLVQTDLHIWPFTVIEGPTHRPLLKVHHQGQEKEFAPEEICAIIISKLKQDAEAHLRRAVTSAVISIPACCSTAQRKAIINAASIAGLEVKRVFNAPLAACVSTYTTPLDQENSVLVFDLGARTLDVCLVKVDSGIHEVLATANNPHLGGNDFDTKLVDDYRLKFKRHCKNLTGDAKALHRLRTACEKAKLSLSFHETANIYIDSFSEGLDFHSTMSRQSFTDMNTDLFKSCTEPVEKALRDAKLSKNQVHRVLLVGGSSRIPMVRSILSEFFNGKELCIVPDEEVAAGIAIMASVLNTDDQIEKLSELLVLDASAVSLGIEVEGAMMTIVKRNSTIPALKTMTISTDTRQIKIYEGECAMVRDNTLLSQMTLQGLQHGNVEIDVTFSIDANSVIEVHAVEKGTGVESTIIITGDATSLSTGDIERMTIAHQTHKAMLH